jgi:hypothetical protein
VYQHDRCIARIDQVLEAAREPASAYLVRSRLQRMLVTVSNLIHKEIWCATGTHSTRQVPTISDP